MERQWIAHNGDVVLLLWDKDRMEIYVVLGQGAIEINLLDKNKQFNVTQGHTAFV